MHLYDLLSKFVNFEREVIYSRQTGSSFRFKLTEILVKYMLSSDYRELEIILTGDISLRLPYVPQDLRASDGKGEKPTYYLLLPLGVVVKKFIEIYSSQS